VSKKKTYTIECPLSESILNRALERINIDKGMGEIIKARLVVESTEEMDEISTICGISREKDEKFIKLIKNRWGE